MSEENSASIEEIMAFIETVNSQITDLAEDTKVLNILATEMKKSVNVFSCKKAAE